MYVFKQLLWRERQHIPDRLGAMPPPGVRMVAPKQGSAAEAGAGLRERGLPPTGPLPCRLSQGATCTC